MFHDRYFTDKVSVKKEIKVPVFSLLCSVLIMPIINLIHVFFVLIITDKGNRFKCPAKQRDN